MIIATDIEVDSVIARILAGTIALEVSGSTICTATQAAGSWLLLKLGPSSDTVERGDLAAMKGYRGDWSIHVDMGSWRLTRHADVLTDSDDERARMRAAVELLLGEVIERLEITQSGSLTLRTANGIVLAVDSSGDPGDTLWSVARERSRWSLALENGRLHLEFAGDQAHAGSDPAAPARPPTVATA